MSSLHSSLAQDALNLYFGVVDKTLLGVRDDLRSMGKSEEQVTVILERLRQKWQQKLSDLHCLDSYGQAAHTPSIGIVGSSVSALGASSRVASSSMTSASADSSGRSTVLTAESIVPRSRKRMRKAAADSQSGPIVNPPSMATPGMPTSLDEIRNPFIHESAVPSVIPGQRTFSHVSAAQMVRDHSSAVDPPSSSSLSAHQSVSSAQAWSALGSADASATTTTAVSSSTSTSLPSQSSAIKPEIDGATKDEMKTMDDSSLISDAVTTSDTAAMKSEETIERSESAMMSLTRADADNDGSDPVVAVGFSDDEDDEDDNDDGTVAGSGSGSGIASSGADRTDLKLDRYELAKRAAKEKSEKRPERPKHMYRGRDLNGPLNSDDDDSGDIADSDIQTDNILICQFEKVDRKKNDWKVQLRNGVLHVQGKDYAFRTFANGSFLWEE